MNNPAASRRVPKNLPYIEGMGVREGLTVIKKVTCQDLTPNTPALIGERCWCIEQHTATFDFFVET